ncbi:MAG: superoxide dismutase [Pseudomonadota bacterium]
MIMNRRQILTLSAAAAASLVSAHPAVAVSVDLQLPILPYKEDALAPVISARTVGLHYGKHHKGYFDKLSKLIAGKPYASMTLEKIIVTAHEKKDQDIFNNAAQAWNHNLYWQQFNGGSKAPPEKFTALIKNDFGSIDTLKTKLVEQADKIFGTGWVWLVRSGGKLEVIGMQDAGNPMTLDKKPLLGIDVWEHAYYIDYENRRAEHVQAVLDKLINWEFVASRWDVTQG